MKCIIGLGNPGKKYVATRHNIGFMVIDELARRHQFQLTKEKFNGFYASEFIQGEKVAFLQPQTFMNRSGDCIQPFIDYFKIDRENILVIYDDLDLPVGKIRLRQKGSHGGHNGLRSTIARLNTDKFKRLRVGIGRPTNNQPIVDYVLNKFSKTQETAVQSSIDLAADACEKWLQEDFIQVMNSFN
ncbi:MAG TPA: aminoacyl-tRNA hydrolase [Bacillota bacterium]|nr:aminoacyl-tRNA hydrolase [Bacillota bacterium]